MLGVCLLLPFCLNTTETFFFTLLQNGVSLVVKGCFDSGQSNDLSHVQACMAHVKTGDGDVLKKVRPRFLKSGGRQTPPC